MWIEFLNNFKLYIVYLNFSFFFRQHKIVIYKFMILANLLQFFVNMLHTRCAKCNINFTVFALLVVSIFAFNYKSSGWPVTTKLYRSFKLDFSTKKYDVWVIFFINLIAVSLRFWMSIKLRKVICGLIFNDFLNIRVAQPNFSVFRRLKAGSR